MANTGWLRIYDGTQPANADTAVSTQNILAELRFGATAFGASVAGVATANAITADSSANATGTATWFRVFKSDGTTALWDGSVGTAAANHMDLNTLANDNTFVRRVQIAVAHFASYILNESPSTANHAARYAWARNAILNSLAIAAALAPTVVMDSTVATKLLGTTDAELQAAVEFEAQQLLL